MYFHDPFNMNYLVYGLWGLNDHVPDILGIIQRNGHDLSTGYRRTPDRCTM
ncbi:hypothetical protein HanRHA438_Chr03g0113051 [Helianthus annuus]|nr:hypothetical protein HanRHA438_Chr03g0113051 [Helianthus annuus]